MQTGSLFKAQYTHCGFKHLVEVILHVGKGAKFLVEKVNDGQNICNRVASVGNEKNF